MLGRMEQHVQAFARTLQEFYLAAHMALRLVKATEGLQDRVNRRLPYRLTAL